MYEIYAGFKIIWWGIKQKDGPKQNNKKQIFSRKYILYCNVISRA